MTLKIRPSIGGNAFVGMLPAKDFKIEAVQADHTFSAKEVRVNRHDSTMSLKYAVNTNSDNMEVVLTGNTKGLKNLRFIDMSGETHPDLEFIGGMKFTTKRFHSIFMLEAETEYGVRRSPVYSITREGYSDPFAQPESVEMNYIKGSLGYHIWENMKKFVATKIQNEYTCQFLDGGNYGPTNDPDGSISAVSVTPNPNFHYKGYDWSGISLRRAGNLEGDTWKLPCTLISPRHAIFAKHVIREGGKNTWVSFRKKDGTIIKAKIVDGREFPEIGSTLSNGEKVTKHVDLALAYFDRDLTDCSVFKVLPKDWIQYVPSMVHIPQEKFITGNNLYAQLPALMRAGNTGLGVTTNHTTWNSPNFIVNLFSSGAMSNKGEIFFNMTNPDDTFAANHRFIYGGDSSSPSFLLIQEGKNKLPTPVLATVCYTAGTGPDIAHWSKWIQSTMDELAKGQSHTPHHKLQIVDLSRFQKFAPTAIHAYKIELCGDEKYTSFVNGNY